MTVFLVLLRAVRLEMMLVSAWATLLEMESRRDIRRGGDHARSVKPQQAEPKIECTF